MRNFSHLIKHRSHYELKCTQKAQILTTKKKLVSYTKLTLSTTHMRKGKNEYMKEDKIFKEHDFTWTILWDTFCACIQYSVVT
jgi:hypothetical protein